MDAYERMKKLIVECDDDIKKAVGGNKAAGTRVRKTMQEVKECAQSVRQGVLNLRDAAEGGPAQSAGGFWRRRFLGEARGAPNN